MKSNSTIASSLTLVVALIGIAVITTGCSDLVGSWVEEHHGEVVTMNMTAMKENTTTKPATTKETVTRVSTKTSIPLQLGFRVMEYAQ